jgi:hypothetical protein
LSVDLILSADEILALAEGFVLPEGSRHALGRDWLLHSRSTALV